MRSGERFVVLGLAHARAEWFRRLGQWCNSAALPVEFVKCVSPVEMRARLATGRPYSAAIVDAGVVGLDRDVVEAARDAGCVVLAVADGRATRDWSSLGVAAVLPFNFTRDELLDTLATRARPIGRSELLPREAPEEADRGASALVVAVCGPGGTGVSTTAVALAQGLAERAVPADRARRVVLADLARHAEQAMLHDARDIVPGVQELVEAHRAARLAPGDVRSLTFHVEERGYDLLLGLRRARFWPVVRPRAFGAALESLRAAYDVVVCDTDADFEGEDDAGSADVEDRNTMSRTAARHAGAVLAVGVPSMKGLHSLVRVIHEVVALGVSPARVVPVVNRAPRGARHRAALAAAVAELVGTLPGEACLTSPLFLPERNVDDILRDGVRLPRQLCAPLAAATLAVWEQAGPAVTGADMEPTPLLPGSLADWTDQEAAGQ